MKLNSNQIFFEIKQDMYAKNIFKKVLARDEIPRRVIYPSAFVINNQKRNQPGQHWLAVYYDKNGSCEFFDSFGMHPSFYGLEKLIRYPFNYNKIQLQSNNSYYCGYYCIYFILLKSRGFSLDQIISLFSQKNLKFNDLIIKNLI